MFLLVVYAGVEVRGMLLFNYKTHFRPVELWEKVLSEAPCVLCGITVGCSYPVITPQGSPSNATLAGWKASLHNGRLTLYMLIFFQSKHKSMA